MPKVPKLALLGLKIFLTPRPPHIPPAGLIFLRVFENVVSLLLSHTDWPLQAPGRSPRSQGTDEMTALSTPSLSSDGLSIYLIDTKWV
jgi:hypothetical protein